MPHIIISHNHWNLRLSILACNSPDCWSSSSSILRGYNHVVSAAKAVSVISQITFVHFLT
jgi:hypothetical protein